MSESDSVNKLEWVIAFAISFTSFFIQSICLNKKMKLIPFILEMNEMQWSEWKGKNKLRINSSLPQLLYRKWKRKEEWAALMLQANESFIFIWDIAVAGNEWSVI